jgi:hypothetical protein
MSDQEHALVRAAIINWLGAAYDEHDYGANPDYYNPKDVEHLLVAIASALDRTWRTIETAPKDGSLVLLYLRIRVVTVGAWREIDARWGYDYRENDDRGDDSPTHWLPIPDPPKEQP